MENRISATLIMGELYIFNKHNPECPAEGSLWGVVERCDKNSVHLENYSLDLRGYSHHQKLPEQYKYFRLSTRDELRDYIYNMATYEVNIKNLKVVLKGLDIDVALAGEMAIE